jgi:hypothetical protein
MASEVLRLTAQIVMSHASMTELTPAQLMNEVKEIFGLLASLESEVAAPESKPKPVRSQKSRKVKVHMSDEAKAVRNMGAPEVGDPDYMDFMEHREG